MSYTEKLTLRELAVHYASYKDLTCLDELEKRDNLMEITPDKIIGIHKDVEGQMMFEFKDPNPVVKEENKIPSCAEYVKGFENGYMQAIEDHGISGSDDILSELK